MDEAGGSGEASAYVRGAKEERERECVHASRHRHLKRRAARQVPYLLEERGSQGAALQQLQGDAYHEGQAAITDAVAVQAVS